MFWKKISAGMFRYHSVVCNGFMRLCRGCQARFVLDCKTVGFFSKSVKKSVKRGVRVLRARSLIADLLFDCSRVLEYAKIRTVLQSSFVLIVGEFKQRRF